MPTNTGNDRALKNGGDYDPYLTTGGSGPGTFGVVDQDGEKLYSKKPRSGSLMRDLLMTLLFVAVAIAVVFVGVHIAGQDTDSDSGDGPPDDGGGEDGGGGDGGGGDHGDDGGGDLPEGPQASNLGDNTQQEENEPTYDTWAAFNEYALTFGKDGQYADETEREIRMQNFQSNTGQADALNNMRSKNKDAVFGWTKFSDLDVDELKPLFGFAPFTDGQQIEGDVADVGDGTLDSIESIDWRDDYRVTPVKNQGYCGSCWAFSAVETIESAMLMESDNPEEDYDSTNQILSEQQVVSCDPLDWGCGGGWPQYAFLYVKGAGGLENGETYPYTSGISMLTEECKDDGDYVPNTVPVSWVYATTPCWSGSCENQDEIQLAHSLYHYGPIGICLNAAVWSWYTSGVVTAEQCGPSTAVSLDHCVQLVGMNLEEEYWIIRNSWGEDWGDAGYIHLSMYENTCGVANMAFYVNLQD